MKKLLLLILITTACSKKESIIEILSRASYGTKDHRIQFHSKAKYIKYSPNVAGFDDISGATYIFDKIESNKSQNNIIYFKRGDADILQVTLKNDNTINTLVNNENPQTFTPRTKNLGRRP